MPALHYPHNITVRRERDSGDKLFISLECTVSPDTPVSDAHDLASYLEEELRRRFEDVAEVSIHLEPTGED
jgi:divalent metal cation (Fe/Co/Zn/Cd) transporter